MKVTTEMKAALFSLVVAIGGCVPSRSAVFSPVDHEIERRLGVSASWDEVRPAVHELLAKPLDRDAAVRIALAMNRRLQAQYDELGIAASDVAAATALGPTTVDLKYKLPLHDHGDGSNLEIEALQDVLDLIQLPQRRGAAQAGLAAARARAVAATIELVATVEARHIDVIAAQQLRELWQTAFDAASASAELTERMYAAGNVNDLTLDRVRVQREQARIELARAQVDVELAREALNEVLGVTGEDTRWTIADRLLDLPEAAPALDALERDAIAANLELQALRSDAEAAAGRLGIARVRAFLPELGVGVAVERTGSEWEAGPALAIGLPIFNQQQGPRARANAELRRAENESYATAVELRALARATRQRVLEAHAEARHLFTVVLPLRQRIADETLRQYNAMNASTFELLVARRELVESAVAYIEAQRRYWRATAETRALTRGATPRGEGRPNASTSASSSTPPSGGH